LNAATVNPVGDIERARSRRRHWNNQVRRHARMIPDSPALRFDADPAAVPDARARVLDELIAPDTYGFGIHFGDQPFGRVDRDDDGFRDGGQYQPRF